MENIRELFDIRDEQYKNFSTKINLQLQFVYDAIIEFFNEPAEKFEWVSVNLSETDVLVVVGKIVLDIQERMFKVITVGIPMNIIEKQSRSDVVIFLHEANEEFKKRIQEEEDIAKDLITRQLQRALQ